jgi:hypothetical protein
MKNSFDPHPNEHDQIQNIAIIYLLDILENTVFKPIQTPINHF